MFLSPCSHPSRRLPFAALLLVWLHLFRPDAGAQSAVDGDYGGAGNGGIYQQNGSGPITGPTVGTLIVSGGGLRARDPFAGDRLTTIGALVDAGGGLFTVRATRLVSPFTSLGIPSATVFYIRDGSITATNRAGSIVTWVDVRKAGAQAPTITQQPSDLVLSGEITQTLNVLATGSLPLSYQWYRNGQIAAGRDVALLILGAHPSVVGSWYCVVSNPSGSVTSRVAQVRVDAPAPKATLPATVELVLGATQGFGVTVSGGQEPYTYVWEKNGAVLPGATGFAVNFPDVSAADAGTYRCTVTDAYGNSAVAGPTVVTVQLPAAPRFVSKQAGLIQPAGLQFLLQLRFDSPQRPPATAVWRRNGVPVEGTSVYFDNGTGNWVAVFQVASARPEDSGDYDCVATGPGGVTVSEASRVLIKALDAADTVDLTFNAGTANRVGFQNPNGDGFIEGLAIQADDKILVSGTFKQWNGQARTNLVRLNVDGSVDTGFAAHHFTARVNGDITVPAVAVAPDGRIYVAGVWQTLDGVDDGGTYHLIRLNADGTQDRSLTLPDLTSPSDELVIGTDGTVFNNGVRLVGNALKYLLKFPGGGAMDLGYQDGFTGARFGGNSVGALALGAGGSLVVGGTFGVTVGGFPSFNLAVVNADGSVNGGFRSALQSRDTVNRLVRQADGKIVALGDFADSGGELKRFQADGTFDGGFSSPVRDAAFGPLAMTRDGLVLVAPNTGNNLARLRANGSVDETFTVAVNQNIKLTAVDSKGRIVVAGFFTEVRGSFDDVAHAVGRVRIARLTGGSGGGGGAVEPTPVSLGSVVVTPGGALGLSVPTQVGLTYVLEKQTGLGSGVWTAVQTVVGDGSVKTLEGAIEGQSGFFRIRIQR